MGGVKMSHDSLTNFASCLGSQAKPHPCSSRDLWSGLPRHIYSLQPQTAPAYTMPPSTQGLKRLLVGQLQGPARCGAAVIWLYPFQHSPNSPAHSKGMGAGRSVEELNWTGNLFKDEAAGLTII